MYSRCNDFLGTGTFNASSSLLDGDDEKQIESRSLHFGDTVIEGGDISFLNGGSLSAKTLTINTPLNISSLDSSGTVTVDGTFLVSKDVTIESELECNNGIKITGNLLLRGQSSIYGPITVLQNSTLVIDTNTSEVYCDDGINVQANSSFMMKSGILKGTHVCMS